ncbi:polysaccharide deacetylase family protein [Maribellus luteus]|uniref:Polysaccharide deacetylase family protein n=1 Tax=Maribellus luteus TaxID=2305463 RepID=A0A399T1W0_9BACT|nr:polysaccharide deacetylase family protein [Maribellus luteus]RIJ49818.1 polysaccharide deacetylase family protein [Maribellus luteus]
MANIPRSICKQVARVVPAKTLLRLNTPAFLPFYHTVSNSHLAHVLNYPYRDADTFENELDYLLKYFTPVSLEDFYKNSHGSGKNFHLTFDDGLSECAEVIAPILSRKGIPATFFINSDFVGNKALFHRYKASLLLNGLLTNPDSETESFLAKHGLFRHNLLKTPYHQNDLIDQAAELLEMDFAAFLKEQQPYMTKSQLKQLHKQGFTIGGHSCSHPEFWLMKKNAQFDEIEKNMEWINRHFEPKIKAFAFPFTDHGVSEKLLSKLVKKQICDITFGTAGLKFDSVSTHFQRYPVEMPGDFVNNLKAEFLYFLIRKWVGKARVKH